MANATDKNPIVLDTFTSAINLGTLTGKSSFAIEWIYWQQPTTVNHTCTVTDNDGLSLFDEICVVAKESKVLYFNGSIVNNIKIPESGVSSGKLLILLRHRKSW
jgi:hypothetical protein